MIRWREGASAVTAQRQRRWHLVLDCQVLCTVLLNENRFESQPHASATTWFAACAGLTSRQIVRGCHCNSIPLCYHLTPPHNTVHRIAQFECSSCVGADIGSGHKGLRGNEGPLCSVSRLFSGTRTPYPSRMILRQSSYAEHSLFYIAEPPVSWSPFATSCKLLPLCCAALLALRAALALRRRHWALSALSQ